MQSFTQVKGRKHQAAITGKVVDGRTTIPIRGVTVHITAHPPAFAQQLSAFALRHGPTWEQHPQRPDRTRTAEDGCFRFVNLPDGSYTLQFSLAQGRHRYGSTQSTFTVERDEDGDIQSPIHEVVLPPTGVDGQIKGLVQGSATVLPMARIRVEGSGELAYGDEQGRFYLTGVEPGTRTLRISAMGFQPATAQASIAEGTITSLAVQVLDPLP
jgi:hypothetical protein